MAQDSVTGEQGYFEVVAVTNHPTDEILRVTLDEGNEGGDDEDDAQLNTQTDDDQPTKSEVMEITPDHPVYVEGKGWLWAENLVVGDRLRRSDGGWAKVLAVERVELDQPEVVYNFTVKEPHTYFVLEAGVLVHNAGCVWYPGAGKGTGRWRDKGGFISFDEARNRVELPGEAVDIQTISKESHIPERLIEPVQEIALEHQVICAFRDCNKNLDKLLETGNFWPKDTNVPIFNRFDQSTPPWLKASSAVDPRFKTNSFGLVQVELSGDKYGILRKPSGIFELEYMDNIIDGEGKIRVGLEGIPMGPDIDTYFFLKRTETGFVNLGTDTPEELYMRWLIGREMSYEIEDVGSISLIGHGPAQPHFGYAWTNKVPPPLNSWGNAFVVMPDGQLRVVKDQQMEAFFRYLDRDLTTFRKGPGPISGHGVSKLKNPWISTEYPPLPENWLAH